MQNSIVESLIGAVVIAVGVLFFGYAYTTTGSGAVSGYEVTAKFDRADGISVGSDVRLSGIKVDGKAVTVGAMTRHAEVASSAAVMKAIPALAALVDALRARHGGQALRTIGGEGDDARGRGGRRCGSGRRRLQQ